MNDERKERERTRKLVTNVTGPDPKLVFPSWGLAYVCMTLHPIPPPLPPGREDPCQAPGQKNNPSPFKPGPIWPRDKLSHLHATPPPSPPLPP